VTDPVEMSIEQIEQEVEKIQNDYKAGLKKIQEDMTKRLENPNKQADETVRPHEAESDVEEEEVG